jgi:hypothetical protein
MWDNCYLIEGRERECVMLRRRGGGRKIRA